MTKQIKQDLYFNFILKLATELHHEMNSENAEFFCFDLWLFES